MRTAPVALAYLDDEDAMVEGGSGDQRTHPFDPDTGDATVCCGAARFVTPC